MTQPPDTGLVNRLSEIISEIDIFVKNEGDQLTLEFEDDDPDFSEITKLIRKHVMAQTYQQHYNFWTDGCNYASLDWIKIYKITEPPIPRSGSCWMSPIWT